MKRKQPQHAIREHHHVVAIQNIVEYPEGYTPPTVESRILRDDAKPDDITVQNVIRFTYDKEDAETRIRIEDRTR